MANKASSGDIFHFGCVRVRVTGIGYLQISINSLQTVRIQNLADQALRLSTDIEPLALANFTNQRGQIVVRTSNINEIFNISKIVVFIRQVATGYPQ